jgi:hypothetical protein
MHTDDQRARRVWSPWLGLLAGLVVAIAGGVGTGVTGVVGLRLMGDRIVQQEIRADARAAEGQRVWNRHLRSGRHPWSLAFGVLGAVGAWGLSASLDRFCALGWIIEIALVVVGMAIAGGIVALCARFVVEPWHDGAWGAVWVFGVGGALVGIAESWRHSVG